MPATYNYTRTPLDGDYNIDHKDVPSIRLVRDLETAFPAEPCVVRIAGTSVDVVFSSETPPSNAATDVVVATNIIATSAAAMDGVKQHYAELVEQHLMAKLETMTWVWTGDATKSLSLGAAFRECISTLQAGAAGLTFPLSLADSDNTGFVAVANAAALTTIADEIAAAFYTEYALATAAQVNVVAAASVAAATSAADAYLNT